MANEHSGKENVGERGIRFLRNIHIGIGAVALAGAVVFPQIEILPVIAAYEGGIALIHEGLRRVVRGRSRQKLKPA
jgi:hypothetical protein